MITPTKEQIETLKRYNSTFRFNRRTYMTAGPPDLHGKPTSIPDEKKSGIYCEIIDLQLNPEADQGRCDMPYCVASGDTESDALANALRALPTAPKQLTQAQQNDPAFLDAQKRIRELETELAAMRDEVGDPEPEGDEDGAVIPEDEPPKIGGLKRLHPAQPKRA